MTSVGDIVKIKSTGEVGLVRRVPDRESNLFKVRDNYGESYWLSEDEIIVPPASVSMSVGDKVRLRNNTDTRQRLDSHLVGVEGTINSVNEHTTDGWNRGIAVVEYPEGKMSFWKSDLELIPFTTISQLEDDYEI